MRIRLFAVLRERAGARDVELELPEGARVRDALAQLSTLTLDVPVVMAVNREYATADVVLCAGDELALIPPVSGGAAATHALDRGSRRKGLGSRLRGWAWSRISGRLGVVADLGAPEATRIGTRPPSGLAAYPPRACGLMHPRSLAPVGG